MLVVGKCMYTAEGREVWPRRNTADGGRFDMSAPRDYEIQLALMTSKIISISLLAVIGSGPTYAGDIQLKTTGTTFRKQSKSVIPK